MEGLYDRQPRFSLVAAYMSQDVDGLGKAIERLEREIVRLMADNIIEHSETWPRVIDKVTLLIQERVRLQSTRAVLVDDAVRAALPALRIAWTAMESRVTPHEMEKILRDPPQSREMHDVCVVREAWLPVSLAGAATLAATSN